MAKKIKTPTSPSRADTIRAEIKKLEAELKALDAGVPKETVKGKKPKSPALKPSKGRRPMSPEAREKIAEAQRKRWAKARRKK